MSKRVAVILSGCGVFDGAEIHESVLTLLALDEADAKVRIFAPDIAQHHVVDHRTGEAVGGETRNVRREAARIARGEVEGLSELDPSDFDAIVLPGGFGAAKNLCSFAVDGRNMTVLPELEAILLQAREQNLVLGFLCISPIIAAKIFGPRGVVLTIGNDAETASAVQGFGASHRECPVDGVVVDETLRVVSSPAYMLAGRIREAARGIRKFVDAVLEIS